MDVGWWALIVSCGSFAVSALTFWRNRTPTPRWDIVWDYGQDDEPGDLVTDSIRATARNRGKGVARDVRLNSPTVDGGRGWAVKTADAVAFGEEIALWFSFEDGKHADAGGPHRDEVQFVDPELGTARIRGYHVVSRVEVELTWSQEPNLHRRRRKRATFTHD